MNKRGRGSQQPRIIRVMGTDFVHSNRPTLQRVSELQSRPSGSAHSSTQAIHPAPRYPMPVKKINLVALTPQQQQQFAAQLNLVTKPSVPPSRQAVEPSSTFPQASLVSDSSFPRSSLSTTTPSSIIRPSLQAFSSVLPPQPQLTVPSAPIVSSCVEGYGQVQQPFNSSIQAPTQRYQSNPLARDSSTRGQNISFTSGISQLRTSSSINNFPRGLAPSGYVAQPSLSAIPGTSCEEPTRSTPNEDFPSTSCAQRQPTSTIFGLQESSQSGRRAVPKRVTWPQDDTYRLIALYRQLKDDPKYKRVGLRLTIWSDIADRLADNGGNRYSGSSCHDKFNNLSKKFISRADLIHLHGPTAVKPWQYHDSLANVVEHKPKDQLRFVKEVGGVKKRGGMEPANGGRQDYDADEDSDVIVEPTERPPKRLKLGEYYEQMIMEDRARKNEDRETDAKLLELLAGIKSSSDRKAQMAERNGQDFSRLTEAFISNLARQDNNKKEN